MTGEHGDNGYDCFMWWPEGRELTPVQRMALCKKNAKFLEVSYYGKKRTGKSKKKDQGDDELEMGKSIIDFKVDDDDEDIVNAKNQRKTVNEAYNLLDLHMCSLNGIKNSGIKSDLLASDYLKNKLGCTDSRVGRYNVLRITHV